MKVFGNCPFPFTSYSFSGGEGDGVVCREKRRIIPEKIFQNVLSIIEDYN